MPRFADVVALQAGVEERIARKVRIYFARRLDMRCVMRAKTAALAAKIVIGCLGRRARFG
jgi:hypothetical protein